MRVEGDCPWASSAMQLELLAQRDGGLVPLLVAHARIRLGEGIVDVAEGQAVAHVPAGLPLDGPNLVGRGHELF